MELRLQAGVNAWWWRSIQKPDNCIRELLQLMGGSAMSSPSATRQ